MAILSSVLNSERAIQVNIIIIRTFVHMRKILQTHKDLAAKIEKPEQKYDEKFKIVFAALKQLIKEENKPRPGIGFR